jgi:transposase-like protein
MAAAIESEHFHNEEAARKYLEAIRWPDGPVCPHCGSAVKPYKTARVGKYRCGDKDCRKDFTVRVGTVFEASHIPLHKWLLAAYLLCSSKKGISSHQLHRVLGLTYKTAWFMSHRLREAMRNGGPFDPLGGAGKVVEIDETFIGRNPYRKLSRGPSHKLAVLSLVERGGRARSFHVPGTRATDLVPIIEANVHHESEVMTDEGGQYWPLGWVFPLHHVVNHSRKEYVRGRISTNTVEGFYSIFKRGMTGVYQHCSAKHLHRYIAEFDFRYSERQVTDSERTNTALSGIIGKRLKYRD